MTDRKIADEVKAFIIQALACYDAPSTVAEAVNAEFGVKTSRQAIERYDPTKHAGQTLSEKWRIKFESARQAFKVSVDSVPLANRAYRLRVLQRMADRAEAMKNYALVAQLIEQAAKDCGEVFTNKQKLDSKLRAKACTVIVPAKV